MTQRANGRWPFLIRNAWMIAIALFLTGCGGGMSQGDSAQLAVRTSGAGPTPFIAFAEVKGEGVEGLASIRFTIEPKEGAKSAPVNVSYSLSYLARRGYATTEGGIVFPIFGLYAGRSNLVRIEFEFADHSMVSAPLTIDTPAYSDVNGIYDRVNILKPRQTGASLGFNYFYLKSSLGTPVIVDTDGNVRWVGPGTQTSASSIFDGETFVIASQNSLVLRRLAFDGTSTEMTVDSTSYTNFHHNVDAGKVGFLGEVDAVLDGQAQIESILVEMSKDGRIVADWDYGAILTEYMRNQGDDPTLFVRPGVDWFHMNAAAYDPRDDSIIASSRENFVIKVDYRSRSIVWILGDPTKYWYTFPSLRAKSLTLAGGGLYPIGQHGVSVTSDGLLLLFNNGYPSFQQPANAPQGETRTYSAVSAYAIDASARTALEAWRFDYGQSVFSDICSSANQTPDGSVLINYSAADQRTKARVVGLDNTHQVVFDLEYPTRLCQTSFNAQPISLEALQLR